MARLSIALFALLPTVILLAACDPAIEEPGDGMERPGDEDLADEGDADDGDDRNASDQDPGDPGGPQPEPEPEPRPTAVEPCDWDAPWDGYACETEDRREATNHCIIVDGEEFWTPCGGTMADECVPGEGYSMGCIGETCYWDGEAFRRYYWSEPDCNTPLVLNFDGGEIEYSAAAAASFDLSTDGTCMSTDWPTAPWLALDRDGDGLIRSGRELFGNATPMSSGRVADHGFAALAELDTNRDGKISAADERFGELLIWSDLDNDRVGTRAELHPLRETSLVSIDLGFDRRRVCDARSNCGLERASFEYRSADGKAAFGEVVDVHLSCR